MKRKFIRKIVIGISASIIINMNYVPVSAKWTKDLQDNWKWSDGNAYAKGWKEIEQKWYYFNEDGTMKTGWLNLNESWYNFSDNGEMNIGWKEINNKWYYFEQSGIMGVGWIKENDNWYYTNYSGEMETGNIGIDGKVYTFSKSGELLNGDETLQETPPGAENVTNVKNDKEDKDEKLIKIAYVATESDVLNIRLDASISSDIIGTLPKGQEIKVDSDEKNGFYHMTFDGKEGWVSSKWISFDKSVKEDSNQDLDNNEDDEKTNNNKDTDSEIDLDDLEIRDTQPDLDDKHYYSDGNLFYKVKLSPPFFSGGKKINGNCTWYAWGRAWEITGKKPTDAGFIGNGYEWWKANKVSGKYEYGSKPRVGAIAVWKSDLPNSGGSGHVAIVEKIEDGKIYISESQWHGSTFKYREIYETDYLYGYIYLDKPNY